jgi:hypothetical protein
MSKIAHKASWALVGVSILVHAITLVPTREAITLFLVNAGVVAGIRIIARRGY